MGRGELGERAGLGERGRIAVHVGAVYRALHPAHRSPEVMRSGLVTASEDEDVERTVAMMRDHVIRRIPIVDLRGRLRGIPSLDDVLCWMREQAASRPLELHGEEPRPDPLLR